MVKTEQNADIRSLPLSMLPRSSKQVLSDLMNSTKVIPTDGTHKLHRDWRGLAALANISAEVEAGIQDYPDKTARVLEVWTRNVNVTVGDLLDSLQLLNRYDVFDDICLDLTEHSGKNHQRIANPSPPPQIPSWADDIEAEILTIDDRPGYKHIYDAYVLYAEEDQKFVDDIKINMAKEGLEICTKDRLLAGHATQYGPVSKLILYRCRRILLIYSPEFLNSPANSFCRDFAQAIGIETRKNKTIPIMYRDCELPPHHMLYFMLRYDATMYDFWQRLAHTLHIARMPRVMPNSNGRAIQSAHSTVNIVEIPNTEYFFPNPNEERRLTSQRSVSVEAVPVSSSPEGSISSETSQEKKKKKAKGLLKFYKRITGKKSKKEIMVA